jgi:hypothetical protein
MTGVVISLTKIEYEFASYAGFLRHRENTWAQVPERYGSKGEDLDKHTLGAVGEYCLAKYLDRHWSGPGRMKQPDVGREIQIRTSNKVSGHLLLHKADNDDDYFVAVAKGATTESWHVKGWVYGRDGKLQEFWKTLQYGRPCYVIPNEILRSMVSLREIFSLRVN